MAVISIRCHPKQMELMPPMRLRRHAKLPAWIQGSRLIELGHPSVSPPPSGRLGWHGHSLRRIRPKPFINHTPMQNLDGGDGAQMASHLPATRNTKVKVV